MMELAKAFQIAVSGRPGPTHVEIAESALTVNEIEVEQAALVSGPTSVYDGAENAKSNVECDALLLNETSRTDTFPYIEIEEQSANVGHEATSPCS